MTKTISLADDAYDMLKSLNIKIHLINVNSLSKITATLRNEIIKKHMIINKTDELIRWLFW